MIRTVQDFIELRTRNDTRATFDSAPESVWLDLIRDHPEFKEWVIHNKTVPLSVLRNLAADPDPRVRFWVATKRKCSPDLFEQLAADSDEMVRARVAWNPGTPADVLDKLRQDPSRLVQEALARREK
ncbi:MAG TPA: hypothetical protein VML55_04445 [Planctomycetaceae bacterium]|nr:hypothetical protein [Planctomycetaceae bacterium]